MANRGSFPHPVVDDSDDVASTFEVINIAYEPTQEDIEIRLTVRTDDSDLAQLIATGAARHSLRWTCTATISTDEVSPELTGRTGDGWILTTSIDQQRVRGNVDADVRVIATESIAKLRWTNQHAEYGGASFRVWPGDLIADGGSFRIAADKLYDPLNPPIGSCFKFHRDAKLRKGIRVNLLADHVVVSLTSATFDGLVRAGDRPELQIATVVLPALMETISFIKDNHADDDSEGLDGRDWYVAIRAMVEEIGGFDQSPLLLAQRILENPIDRVLTSLDLDGDDE